MELAPVGVRALAAGVAGGAAVLAHWVLRKIKRKRRPAAPPYKPERVPMPHPDWVPGTPQPSPFPPVYLKLDPTTAPPLDIYTFLMTAVCPRPIALVSSCNKEGAVNLAPYSFFNMFGFDPPVVCLGMARSVPRGGGKKDTLNNIEATGEFVVNTTSDWFIESANHACGDFPPEVDELALAGLTPIPSEKVRAPRVQEAAVQMECKLMQVVDIPNEHGRPPSAIVIGQIVLIHVAEGVTGRSPHTGKLVVDPTLYCPVGRLGGVMYCRTNQFFDLGRPGMETAHQGPAVYTETYRAMLEGKSGGKSETAKEKSEEKQKER